MASIHRCETSIIHVIICCVWVALFLWYTAKNTKCWNVIKTKFQLLRSVCWNELPLKTSLQSYTRRCNLGIYNVCHSDLLVVRDIYLTFCVIGTLYKCLGNTIGHMQRRIVAWMVNWCIVCQSLVSKTLYSLPPLPQGFWPIKHSQETFRHGKEL